MLYTQSRFVDRNFQNRTNLSLSKMRFLSNGPDIPTDLIALQERGRTIFVCGAGVSMTIGLPNFRELVEFVYQDLREDWNLHVAEREGMQEGGELEGEYDRVLRCLERRLDASNLPSKRGMRQRILSAVRKKLTPPSDSDFASHLALLELSRDEQGQTRLLTTNFDTVFERAWFDKHHARIPSHAGAGMPQPRIAGFSGVLHLHGRLADERTELGLDETELILTSADFGEAYLRSGWASRYVYDLARSHTIVLVGYTANDPPMRYLLEALEADRERYPDLNHVYAFAPCSLGEEEIIDALWRAKGVVPILYVAEEKNHSALNQTIREWRHYADDPTAWRRERLRKIFLNSPISIAEGTIKECASLLRHGDAAQLLGELVPDAAWLPVLMEQVFDKSTAHLGEWVSKRISDPEMIRVCAGLPIFDDNLLWEINRAIERERSTLSPVRVKAWQLMVRAKYPRRAIDYNDRWSSAVRSIKQGDVGYETRRRVASILRPTLEVSRTSNWREAPEGGDPESLRQLLTVDFSSTHYPSPDEILKARPQDIDHEVDLFLVLNRVLIDALEEACDAGFLDSRDRASNSVPSVAAHVQNQNRDGFCPITRVLADLWQRIASRNPQRAYALSVEWRNSPFLLARRLFLYALSSKEVFKPEEAASMVVSLNDGVFWQSGARVEIMRLLSSRWSEFSNVDRNALEARVQRGMPRDLYPPDAFDSDEMWEARRDWQTFSRFERIIAGGGKLSSSSLWQVRGIAARHPKWRAGPDDRDDFSMWHEIGFAPKSHPEILKSVGDQQLVAETLRLQREQPFEEGDLWRQFCSIEPGRALRGLQLHVDTGRDEIEAWRQLIDAAKTKGDQSFQLDLAKQLVTMADELIVELLPSATSWLRERREVLIVEGDLGGSPFLGLWDRFAQLVFKNDYGEISADRDWIDGCFYEPGGVLAQTITECLVATDPESGSGFGDELTAKFQLVATAQGEAGLLGRVFLVRKLDYLDAIDPTWTAENLLPRLAWDHPEAGPLWRARAFGRIGSARLFKALKPAMVECFVRDVLFDDEVKELVTQLLSVALWRQRGEARDFDLSPGDIKRVLITGPPIARRHVSWRLWRLMADANDLSSDKAGRWRNIVGPLFCTIWPLDARLRDSEISHNLVFMALDCESAFPDAVDAIVDMLVPFELFRHLSHSLRIEKHHDALVSEYPVPFLRMVNAIIDPAAYQIPEDLGAFLQDCVTVNPTVVNEPSYIRLYGLRRYMGA